MEMIALIVSLVSLAATVFVYVKHDRKLKQQESLINQYQLEQIKEETASKKSAVIHVAKLMIPNSHGGNNIYLEVTNTGAVKARNLKVWTRPNALVGDYEVPYFNPGQEERRTVILSLSSGDQFEAFYRWDDDLGAHEDSVVISFG